MAARTGLFERSHCYSLRSAVGSAAAGVRLIGSSAVESGSRGQLTWAGNIQVRRAELKNVRLESSLRIASKEETLELTGNCICRRPGVKIGRVVVKLGFQTKDPSQRNRRWHREMLERAVTARSPARWVTADEVSSMDSQFRNLLEKQGFNYVATISCRERLFLSDVHDRVDGHARALQKSASKKLSCGSFIAPRWHLQKFAVVTIRWKTGVPIVREVPFTTGNFKF